MKIIKLEKVDSTNNYVKKLLAATRPAGADRLPLAVTAREQFAGRGRYGNSFHSPVGGLYLSYAFSANYDLETLEKVTTVAAAIVHSTLSEYSSDLYIKPVNDIYLDNRKICGILTERVDEINLSSYYIIVGIGINIFPNNVPADLSDTIGFLLDSAGDTAIIDNLADKLADALDSVFGSGSTVEFSALNNYYQKHCR